VGAEVARRRYNLPFVVEEIKAEKELKNTRGRVEERGERPGMVAPERIGLLDKMMRDGLEAEEKSI
jgi:hypothetical protein